MLRRTFAFILILSLSWNDLAQAAPEHSQRASLLQKLMPTICLMRNDTFLSGDFFINRPSVLLLRWQESL